MTDHSAFELLELKNGAGLRAVVMGFGATLVSLEVACRAGRSADVTLGYSTPEQWQQDGHCIGATVGRYGNRIENGCFQLEGKSYQLAQNHAPSHLHGGDVGFNKRVWASQRVSRDDEQGIRFTYQSPAGEEGFPGTLSAAVTYWLTEDNALWVEFEATTDAPTVVNLINHAYWNLSGARDSSIEGHELLIHADAYLPMDNAGIPLLEAPVSVSDTPFDFRTPHLIGARIESDHPQIKIGQGYDHCFVIRGSPGQLRHAATVTDPVSGRVMELHTDQPGVQFYAGNFLDGSLGKDGVPMVRRTALCLETQSFPNSPNRNDFPNCVLRPGETYRHVMEHRFTTLL